MPLSLLTPIPAGSLTESPAGNECLSQLCDFVVRPAVTGLDKEGRQHLVTVMGHLLGVPVSLEPET